MSLARFTEAQDGVYPRALAEIRAGRKTSHWMWFIFPQLRGLGHSPTAQLYGIADLDEARAYFGHPVLGHRLEEIAGAMLDHAGTDAEKILGPVDAMKLRSSATLFEEAGGSPVFAGLLDSFHAGQRCEKTQSLLSTGV
ncbi:MAG: DUF1810 domain-containing protein [Pseudooceanicola nanhaiensis]